LLYPLIFLAFLSFSPVISLNNCGQKTNSCAVSSGQEEKILKDVQSLRDASLQKIEDVLADKEFQTSLTEMKIKEPATDTQFASEKMQEYHIFPDFSPLTAPSFYVFVSFSLEEIALLNLAEDAKRYGATLVLRGFKEGSYIKTARALQKIIQKVEQGFIIDPELFTLFAVTTVPTLVLSHPIPLLSQERIQTPIHDRLQGHVSLRYALEVFAKNGDLERAAQDLLQKGRSR